MRALMATGPAREATHRDDLTPQVAPWRGPKGEVVARIAVAAADHAPVRTQLTHPLRSSRSSLQQLHGFGSTVAVGA